MSHRTELVEIQCEWCGDPLGLIPIPKDVPEEEQLFFCDEDCADNFNNPEVDDEEEERSEQIQNY